MAQATLQSHPAPSLQKAISQGFRAEQVAAGEAAGEAAGQVWDRKLVIAHARSSWASMYPGIAAIVNRGFDMAQARTLVYYNTCRISAGYGPMPASVKVKPVSLSPDHVRDVLNATGLGWFLHMVAGGAMMLDAQASARSKLAGGVSDLVLSGARDWLSNAAEADPDAAGIRRVTSGTCDFCADLASQGVNPESARNGQGWHNFCQCTAEPAFGSDTGPSPSLPDSGVASAPAASADSVENATAGATTVPSGTPQAVQQVLSRIVPQSAPMAPVTGNVSGVTAGTQEAVSDLVRDAFASAPSHVTARVIRNVAELRRRLASGEITIDEFKQRLRSTLA